LSIVPRFRPSRARYCVLVAPPGVSTPSLGPDATVKTSPACVGADALLEGRRYETHRGMGSIDAMKQGSADRYSRRRAPSRLRKALSAGRRESTELRAARALTANAERTGDK
jgi:hypothetical protein